MKPLSLRITLVALALVTLAPGAFADLNMVQVGALIQETWEDAAVFGTTAYIAAKTNVTLLDVADATDPVTIKKLPLTGTIDGVLVVGTNLYVARGTEGVSIYDLADPENPSLIASSPVRAHHLHHDSGRLYVCGGPAGLAVIDVANPAAPALLRVFNNGDYVNDVQTNGNIAYLGVRRSNISRLRIIDTQPDPPVLLGSWSVSQNTTLAPVIALDGSIIYFASPDFEYSAVVSVDVSNPASPYHLDYQLFSAGAPTDIQFADGHVHVLTFGALETFNVETPSDLQEEQAVEFSLWDSRRATIVGDKLYAAAGSVGLYIIDIQPPDTPVLLTWHEIYYSAGRVTVHGDRVYASGNRLWVIDISDPTQPVITGDVDIRGGHRTVAVGNRLYMAGDAAGLVVMDITDPDDPVIVDADPTYLVIDVRVSGNFLYTTDTSNRLRIYDLDDPDNPEPRGSVATVTRPYYMALYGNHAYMTDLNSRIFVVDITNPDAPLLVNTVTETAKDLEASDGRLYIAGDADGLQILDLSNPVVPALVGTHDFPQNTNSVDIQGSRAFVTNELGPISVLDVTNPGSIVEVGNHGTPAFSYDIAAAGNLVIDAMNGRIVVYQLAGTAGVDPVPAPKPPVIQLTAAPNPTRGATQFTINVEEPGPVDLAIFDITGRLIHRRSIEASSGATTITWDPISDSGLSLAPGTYLVQARSATARTSQRLTIIR